MDTRDYLYYIVKKIHTTVVATVDDHGLPVTCAVDIMDCDGSSLYFLTARGKNFYHRLKTKGALALTGIKGEDTMSSVAVSVCGRVRELGADKVSELFDKNPYMYDIYPDKKSRSAVSVFQIYEGTGEWFDLSKKPVERAAFSFGGAEIKQQGYFAGDACIGCGLCYAECPQKCIDISVKPAVINQSSCLHCGNCFEICPVKAIVKRG